MEKNPYQSPTVLKVVSARFGRAGVWLSIGSMVLAVLCGFPGVILLLRDLPPGSGAGVVYESEFMGRPADFDLIKRWSFGLAIAFSMLALALFLHGSGRVRRT